MGYAVPRISPAQKDAARPDAEEISQEGERNADPVSRQWTTPFPEERDPHRYLLLLRFSLLNLVAFALLGAAYAQGLVDKVITADRTHLAVVIFFVFLAGLAICAWKVWQTSRELNDVRSFNPDAPSVRYIAPLLDRDAESRANLTGALRMKLSHRISVVRNIANSLVLLGLIGTVLGFIIALSGVDPENASEVSSIAPMVSTLIDGMSTALYTTLVGAVLNVWLMANHQLLAGGTVKLISGLVVLAETHARD
ncbi:MAG TPA: MotA/TolQ/ExbB proton channel family protein [Gammaproteobacteria bacterium]|nr:MotA/TolQ/ExbB proton channel family protein [Gammaproteobacteria bacterium]